MPERTDQRPVESPMPKASLRETTKSPPRASIVGRHRKPDFIATCNPSLVDQAPTGARWAHEIKWDGYRAQAHLDDGNVKVFTRAGNNWSAIFHPVAEGIARLRADSAILDGEIIALKGGVSDFHELRRQLREVQPAIIYQAFDLLWLDGEDLRPLPLRERKRRLAALIGVGSRHLNNVEHFETDGGHMLTSACRLDLEGIVSKRLDSPYRSGRSNDWLKTKCEVSETLSVIGYGADGRGRVEALYLAREEEGALVYVGTVDRGISKVDLAELQQRLPGLVERRPVLAKPPAKAKAKWVRPQVKVEVIYPNKSADGRLRHPSFKGLRDDLTKA